jgi:hypothetical protein
MNEAPQKSAVEIALDEDRRKSEIKAILQDLERLKTVPLERRRRWVWELLQNAKDCAKKQGTIADRTVNIQIIHANAQLSFSHDGIPFTLHDLLAIVRRTSTKSFDNSDSNTGKFGTGFVTTHALNRMAKISGLLEARNGLLEFTIPVDRRADEFGALEVSLNEVFETINSFFEGIGFNTNVDTPTTYKYELDSHAVDLAQKSLLDFVKNLPFTLLINSTADKAGIGTISVTIENESVEYSLATPQEIFTGVMFSELNGKTESLDGQRQGLIHFSNEHVTIAVPAKYHNGIWEVQKIEKEIKLFKEFPLIGTETWHIPFLLQSSYFLPSEPRDGIRTYKDSEERADSTADINRDILIYYREAVISFFTILQKTDINNLYLLTETGLPEEKVEYTAREWFSLNIQKPLRDFFSSYSLFRTASGKAIPLSAAKIPMIFSIPEDNFDFYRLAVKVFPDQFPDDRDFTDWQRIVSQDPQRWGTSLICTEEDLLKCIVTVGGLNNLQLGVDETKAKWLNQLINFLHRIGRHDLADSYSIYPNTNGDLHKKEALRKDSFLTDLMKEIGDILGQKVYETLVHPDIKQLDGIDLFDIKAYFTGINTFIGALQPSEENRAKFEAVFQLVSMFPNDLARERNKWYGQIRQLLPTLIPSKKIVTDMDDFNFGSAELASIKYVCWLIGKEPDFTTFAGTYFENNTLSANAWLNTMLEILYRTTDYQALLSSNAIIPMQDGSFRKLEANVFREDRNALFDPLLKDLYTRYAGKGDARNLLISNEITIESLPWTTADLLAKPIDNLFISPDIQENVETGKPLNPLFHSLNDWFSRDESNRGILFPHFRKERPVLYIKAFGPEVSKMVMALSKIDKSAEEIQALAELEMSAVELNALITASKMAGGTERLLLAAQEIRRCSEDAAWRKAVGDAAEEAFSAAIADVKALTITNPDFGYDFEIHHNGNSPYLLEIKSTVAHNETVKMSSTQGRTAKNSKDRYALCVVLRDQHDTVVDKNYFIANARFILNIGEIIESKVEGMEQGLATIGTYNSGEVQTRLDNDKYSVNVGRATWKTFLSFKEFIAHLQSDYFKIPMAVKINQD